GPACRGRSGRERVVEGDALGGAGAGVGGGERGGVRVGGVDGLVVGGLGDGEVRLLALDAVGALGVRRVAGARGGGVVVLGAGLEGRESGVEGRGGGSGGGGGVGRGTILWRSVADGGGRGG